MSTPIIGAATVGYAARPVSIHGNRLYDVKTARLQPPLGGIPVPPTRTSAPNRFKPLRSSDAQYILTYFL